jgi:uncharacterized protein
MVWIAPACRLTLRSPHAMIVGTTREAIMRAQAHVHEVPLDRVDLEALDRFLMSDRSPAESAVRSRRLPHRDRDRTGTGDAERMAACVFGGEAPEFADEAEAKAILGAIMGRYNEILRQIADDDLEPVFWADRAGTLIAADWAEGFLQAIMLRADAWGPLFKSKRDGQLLVPILALCGDENGASLLGLPPEEEDRVMEEATEFVPICVTAIAAYWRAKGSTQISMPLVHPRPAQPDQPPSKIGRNQTCPCGSGKKFKKCCGKAT